MECPLCKLPNYVGKIPEEENTWFCSKCYIQFDEYKVYSIFSNGEKHVLFSLTKAKREKTYSEEKLKGILLYVQSQVNKIPTIYDLRKFNFSANPFIRVYGSYDKALEQIYKIPIHEIKKLRKKKKQYG